MKIIIFLTIVGVYFTIKAIIDYKNDVVRRKRQHISNVSDEEKKELEILANKCWEKARKEGINLDKLDKYNLAICRVHGDPYTWVIVKLGIRDKILYKTRMTVEEVAKAKLGEEKNNNEGED